MDRKLSDADVRAIADMLHELHVCRFSDIRAEDMSFMKDLIIIYKETRSEIIKWIVRGIVYGVLILIVIGGYFKLKN